jgi:acyl-CoA thioesterase FadM
MAGTSASGGVGLRPELLGWTREIDSPAPDEGGVVSGVQLARMLHDTALDFVTESFGADTPSALHELGVRPILRALGVNFESPLERDSRVVTGARLGVLGTKSFGIEAGIWRGGDGRLIAHGTVSFVAFDVEAGRAVALPSEVADRLRVPRPNYSATESQVTTRSV